MRFRIPITVSDLIEEVRAKRERNESYCVYGNSPFPDAELSTKCFIEVGPDFNDADEEVFSKFVIGNNLKMWFSDELIQDVVDSVLYQSPDASASIILTALKYYFEYDDFMDL